MADGIKFRFDFSLVHEGNLRNGEGLTHRQMGQAIKRAEREAKKLALRHAAGEIGFPGLPFREKEARAVSRYAAGMRKRFTHMLVLGIGGSALGTKAVFEGVGGEGARKGLRLSVADNVDPDEFFPLLRSHPMKTTAVVAISKSGGTAETNAQLALAIESLKRVCGKKWKDHLVMVTDPEKGVFRRFADSLGVATFSVPQNVGGRFSVLSPVGLLPLAAAGVSTEKLLSGARWMESVFRRSKGRKNPVLSAAAVYSHYLVENPKPVQVWFTYGEGLARVAEWWQQLWGESLGKRRGKEPPVGQTPTRAVGVTDQHSQVQLYQDGPADKIFTFVKWMGGREKGNVPASGFAPGMEILGEKAPARSVRRRVRGNDRRTLEGRPSHRPDRGGEEGRGPPGGTPPFLGVGDRHRRGVRRHRPLRPARRGGGEDHHARSHGGKRDCEAARGVPPREEEPGFL